jgi:hypothetical protein
MADPIRVGTPDVAPDTPAHTKGNKEGNELGVYRKQPGHKRGGKSTARRSTGIRARDRNPIVPGAPNISPA